MAWFLVYVVVAMTAVCSADDVGQGRVRVLGRRWKESHDIDGGIGGAGLRGAPVGHQGGEGLAGARGYQIGGIGHGSRSGVLGGLKGAHGLGHGRVGGVDLRGKGITGLKSLAGGRGQNGGADVGWAGQGARYGLGKAGLNDGLEADNHGLGLGQVNRQVKSGRVPRDVLPQDHIQGGVGKIIAGALAGKAGVPQIVEGGLGLGQVLEKSVGNGNVQSSAPVGPGGPGMPKSGAGLGPIGDWANFARMQGGNSGPHSGVIRGSGDWNNRRGRGAAPVLVNLAPNGQDESWKNNNGGIKVNPEGVIFIEDDGGAVIRGDLEWKDIGNGNFQWVPVGQNQDVGLTQAADKNQGAGENQGPDEKPGDERNPEQNHQGAEVNKNAGQKEGANKN